MTPPEKVTREAWLQELGVDDAVTRNALESISAREAKERMNVAKSVADAVSQERAAVVAMLREEERLHEAHGSRLVASSLRHLGDIIERG